MVGTVRLRWDDDIRVRINAKLISDGFTTNNKLAFKTHIVLEIILNRNLYTLIINKDNS